LNQFKFFSFLMALTLLSSNCTRRVTGPAGPQGAQGVPGTDGRDGLNGVGCSVTPVLEGDLLLPYGGAVVLCGDASALISNGAPGEDGEPVPSSSYAIDSIVDPCGDAPGISDEIFLRLANGQLLWLQVDGPSALTARLSLAVPGNWRTTDGSNCFFTISSTLEIENEHY